MSTKNEMTIYDFAVKNIEGEVIDFKIYCGKNLLIVNVASQCGLTAQYQGLEKMYRDYKEQGFIILGFPCNQFAQQEPGTAKEIKEFCDHHYQVTFPLFEKINVNGENTHPLFVFLKEKIKINPENRIEWNFSKFLVNADGQVTQYYSPKTEPAQIEHDLITRQIIIPPLQGR